MIREKPVANWPLRWPPEWEEQFTVPGLSFDSEDYTTAIAAWLAQSPAWQDRTEAERTEAMWAVSELDKLASEANKKRDNQPWKPGKFNRQIVPPMSKKDTKKWLSRSTDERCLELYWLARQEVFRADWVQVIIYANYAGMMSQRHMAFIAESFLTAKKKRDQHGKPTLRNEEYYTEAQEIRTRAKRKLSDLEVARKLYAARIKKGDTNIPSLERLRRIVKPR